MGMWLKPPLSWYTEHGGYEHTPTPEEIEAIGRHGHVWFKTLPPHMTGARPPKPTHTPPEGYRFMSVPYHVSAVSSKAGSEGRAVAETGVMHTAAVTLAKGETLYDYFDEETILTGKWRSPTKKHYIVVPDEYISFTKGYFLKANEGVKGGIVVNRYTGVPITDTYTGPTVSPIYTTHQAALRQSQVAEVRAEEKRLVAQRRRTSDKDKRRILMAQINYQREQVEMLKAAPIRQRTVAPTFFPGKRPSVPPPDRAPYPLPARAPEGIARAPFPKGPDGTLPERLEEPKVRVKAKRQRPRLARGSRPTRVALGTSRGSRARR